MIWATAMPFDYCSDIVMELQNNFGSHARAAGRSAESSNVVVSGTGEKLPRRVYGPDKRRWIVVSRDPNDAQMIIIASMDGKQKISVTGAHCIGHECT